MATTRGSVAAALLWSIAGCAAYRPVPLASPAAILATPMPQGVVAPVVSHPLIAARPIDLEAPLSDLDAARLALVSSPDLLAARARAGVSQAQLFAAGLLPDPQLALTLDRPSNSGFVNALSAGIGFDLAALVTHRDRVAGAGDTARQTHLDVAWTEWLAMNQVRTLVLRMQSLEQQIAVADEARRASAELYQLSERNQQAGDARIDDTTLHQVGFLEASDRWYSLRRQQLAAERALNGLIGVPPQAHLALAAPMPLKSLDGLDADTLIAQATRDRLDLRALQAGYDAQQRGVKVAALRALPLPQLSLNRARDTSAVWTSGVGLSLGLPLWNRGRGDIAVALATRDQLASEYRARVLQTRTDVFAQLQDLRALDAQRRALAERLPTLEQSAEVMRRANREGSVTAVAYEAVRTALLDKKLMLLALEQAQREGEVALETALGRLLWEPP